MQKRPKRGTLIYKDLQNFLQSYRSSGATPLKDLSRVHWLYCVLKRSCLTIRRTVAAIYLDCHSWYCWPLIWVYSMQNQSNRYLQSYLDNSLLYSNWKQRNWSVSLVILYQFRSFYSKSLMTPLYSGIGNSQCYFRSFQKMQSSVKRQLYKTLRVALVIKYHWFVLFGSYFLLACFFGCSLRETGQYIKCSIEAG